jgi:hypothetical protein
LGAAVFPQVALRSTYGYAYPVPAGLFDAVTLASYGFFSLFIK